MKKNDLLAIIMLLLHNDAPFPENKRFLSFYQMVKDMRRYPSSKIKSSNDKNIANLKISSVMKLTYLPLSQSNRNISIVNNVV
jgi:hypothetical protein